MEKNHLKKYRLIREYPGSPKLGTIIKQSPNHWWGIEHDNNCFSGCNAPSEPKNYPEFWEEIVEKDYEILSLLGNDNKVIPYLTNTKCIDFLVNNGFKIYSIKRLSDGEVFTIGDKIQYIDKSILFEEGCPIESFEVHDNKIYINSHVVVAHSANREINNWEHFKKPLFTTEDGIDIYEGDKYWVLNTKVNDWVFEEKAGRDNISYFYKDKSYAEKTKIYYFSTKELAEEYIIMNKPCLSIKEITPIVGKVYEETGVILDSLTRNLKTLVKSKL